jgi:hypothetical protein
MGETTDTSKTLVGRPLGKRETYTTWEDNTESDLRETDCEYLNGFRIGRNVVLLWSKNES